MPLWGRDCPLPALAALAYLSPVGDGPVHSQLALLSHLFCEHAWWCLSIGLFMGYLSHSLGCYLKLVPSDCHQGIQAGPYPKQCSPLLPVPPLLARVGCEHLAAASLGVAVRHVICGFKLFIYFSSWLFCPLRCQGSPQTLQRKCFLVFGNFSLF